MKKWRFVPNQNSTIVGLNDAGIETFTADINKSLVREIIQNSLDAVISTSTEPVRVEFEMFGISRNEIPDVDNLHSIIKKCRDSNRDEPDAYKFFDNADDLMSQSTINVLRISDHNTIGLEGTDTCAKGTGWSRLVKENGSLNKGQSSGGSFGIGKSATFACSDLRIVFYSSLDKKGFKSNFGVAKLVSYNDEKMGWTTGIGYYSENEKFTAIPELATFDKNYIREDTGTDIYILGMHQTDNFKKEFIQSVLLNFLVSIIKNKLIVDIQGEEIKKETLIKYMENLNPYESDDIKSLLDYYYLLTSPDPRIVKIPLNSDIYGKKYGFENEECTLYLREGVGYNRKVLITRKAGMRILEQNRISGSIEFTGVMVIEGNKMNEAFKAMEVPSHDAWEPGRCRGKKSYYVNLLNDFKRYIKNCVADSFGKVNMDCMDAIGASDFLPDRIDEGKEPKLQKRELSTRIKRISEKTVEPTKKIVKALGLSEIDLNDKNSGESGPGKGEGFKPGVGPHPGPGVGPYPGPGEGDNPKSDRDGDKAQYKEVPARKRLVCKNKEEGKYILTFVVPSKASSGKLIFNLSGEQSDFELPISSAELILGSSDLKIEKVESNQIYLNNLIKGEKIRIEITVDFDSYCMMEVDYFASKK